MSKLIQWLWELLLDKCEMPGCCRRGIRGNENIIKGTVVCDYCHSRWWLSPEHKGTSDDQQ